MPFREHVDSFTPEQLDAMTAALNPAIRELGGPASDDIAREMAERVLRRASDGIFSEAELNRRPSGTARTAIPELRRRLSHGN